MSSYRTYKKGYLKVTDGHELYYEFCGNPKGKPVLYLHGGPGSGFSASSKRFFDPQVWDILLFDQRGAGKSRPFASLHENTTPKLIEDIKTLINFWGRSPVFLFGGSWGSTLALAYAETYPKTVNGLLLRGIYLNEPEEMEYFLGRGVGSHFPEYNQRLLSLVPTKLRNSSRGVINYYLNKVLSKNSKESQRYTYEWSRYEMSLLKMEAQSEEEIEKNLSSHSFQSTSPIELHYFKNNCFLPKNFILNNVGDIAHLPVTIVHGRYDFICPPISAYKLHRALKNSKLIYTTAGHGSSEKENKKALKEEVVRFASLV